MLVLDVLVPLHAACTSGNRVIRMSLSEAVKAIVKGMIRRKKIDSVKHDCMWKTVWRPGHFTFQAHC